MISYIILGVGGIYTARWVRRLYRRQLKGLRRIYKYTILSFLVILSVHFIMIFELIFNLMVSNKSESLFSNYQYECLLPALKHTLPELGYFLVIAVFYTIAVIVVNQIVYQSVENYIENYKSHPDKITCMCINILVQGLLLLIGYFSLLISLVKLTAWDTLVWDDSGLLFVISSILAGAMKYPLRSHEKRGDYFLNSYAIFFSIKTAIELVKCLIKA